MNETREKPGAVLIIGASRGIGLATAERVIKRHGGSIWVEALPNRGATFYFSS